MAGLGDTGTVLYSLYVLGLAFLLYRLGRN